MTSPFAPYQNSKLIFKVADGTYSTNAVGNPVPNTQDLTIFALLKESVGATSRYSEEVQKFAGVDGFASLLEGYLVEPKTYPPSLHFLQEGEAKIKGAIASLGDKEVTGRFKLLPVVQSPYVVALKVDLITPIKGIFRLYG